MNDRLIFLESFLEGMYDEHVDSFTYIMETPYNYHYWCEQYQPTLYKKREEVFGCLIYLKEIGE